MAHVEFNSLHQGCFFLVSYGREMWEFPQIREHSYRPQIAGLSLREHSQERGPHCTATDILDVFSTGLFATPNPGKLLLKKTSFPKGYMILKRIYDPKHVPYWVVKGDIVSLTPMVRFIAP